MVLPDWRKHISLSQNEYVRFEEKFATEYLLKGEPIEHTHDIGDRIVGRTFRPILTTQRLILPLYDYDYISYPKIYAIPLHAITYAIKYKDSEYRDRSPFGDEIGVKMVKEQLLSSGVVLGFSDLGAEILGKNEISLYFRPYQGKGILGKISYKYPHEDFLRTLYEVHPRGNAIKSVKVKHF